MSVYLCEIFFMKNKRVIVAMSGGIDSSVAAFLLKKQGYEVVGVTFIMFDDALQQEYRDYVNDAKIVADMLDIKHYTIDVREDFNKKIIKYFVNSYLNGLTPNPCALCNPTIKFKTLADFADKLDAYYFSTGHYAVIKKYNERYFVSKASDDWKDQTYFLWNLPQEYLRRSILPLSKLTKEKVREIAKKQGFTHLVHKKESYDVCFVAGGNYRHFIDDYIKKSDIIIKEGDFITEEGEIVGRHKGITHYTVGQRKGLGIAMGIPYFVKRIDIEKNQIIVAPRENVLSDALVLTNINLMKYPDLDGEKEFLTKIRFRDKGAMAKIRVVNDKAYLKFSKKVFGIAPGQSAVFYENDDLVGGGVIL